MPVRNPEKHTLRINEALRNDADKEYISSLIIIASVMEINDFIDKFAAEFEMTEREEFNETTSYRDLEEWDSLLGLSIIGMINNNYGVKVTGEDIKDAGTIQRLFEIVKSRLK